MNDVNFLLFISTSLIINASPGPDVIFVISNLKHKGWNVALLSILGLALGYSFHIGITYLGISAIIASSPTLYLTLKYFGAAYLIWLGINTIAEALKSTKSATFDHKKTVDMTPKKHWKYLTQGFLTSAINPKVSIFFLSFLPQFIPNQSTNNYLIILLGLIFCAGATIFNLIYCYLSTFVTNKKKTNKIINSLPGGLLIGIGVYMAI